MFTRKGTTKPNRDQNNNPNLESSGHTQGQPHAQPSELSQEQRAAAMDAARFPPPPVPDTTLIGKNFNLEGDNIVIRCKGALSINGTVDADIHCEQLTIAESAHISGAIAADEVEIHGKVEGTVNGAQVTLHQSANVDADINSQFLSIQRGARFDGRSQRVTDASQIAPKLMTSANDETTTTPGAPNQVTATEPAATPTSQPSYAPEPEATPTSSTSYEQSAQTTPDTTTEHPPENSGFRPTGTSTP